MEALAEALLTGQESAGLQDDAETADAVPLPGAGTSSTSTRHVLKRGIFKAASMQDKLLEK